MAMSLPRPEPPDTSATQRSSNEMIKLIRKLRWIGMEEEAERLAREVTVQPSIVADCTVATPRETD